MLKTCLHQWIPNYLLGIGARPTFAVRHETEKFNVGQVPKSRLYPDIDRRGLAIRSLD